MVSTWRTATINGSIAPTRDYTGFTGTLRAGTPVIITDIHTTVFGKVQALSVRNPKTGQRFRNVPLDVFGATGSDQVAPKWRRIVLSGANYAPVRQRVVRMIRNAGTTPIEIDGHASLAFITNDEPLTPLDLIIVLIEPEASDGRLNKWTDILEAAWSTQVALLSLTIDNAALPVAFQPWPATNITDVGDLPLDIARIVDGTADLTSRKRVPLMRTQLAFRVEAIRSAAEDAHPVEQRDAASDTNAGELE